MARLSFLLMLSVIWSLVDGHGRLIEPPSRASAWRYGFNTPPNYNDHELYCGGFSRQWNKNGGKCGICGDAWDGKLPRPHEYGGRYGQGVIVRKYEPAAVIPIRVEITANHNGYFEFRICPHFKNTTQDCLNKNLLELARPQENLLQEATSGRYFPNDGNRIYEMRYHLPNISCSHCVLQWKYIAGNNWGECPDGTSAVGCGPQEEFRACADIQIGGETDIIVRPTIPVRRPGFTRPPYKPAPPRSSTTPTSHEIDDNEIPQDKLPPYYVHNTTMENVWMGLFIAMVAMLLVIISVALIYIYYYQGGRTLKNWLKDKFNKAPETTTAKFPIGAMHHTPVKPPRTKRTIQHSHFDKSDLHTESLA